MPESPSAGMNDAAFDEMVRTLLERAWIPRRRGAPGVATPVAGIEPRMIPTPHGAVATWRIGDGPATLLVHGWQDDASLWSPLMMELVTSAKPTVAFDLPAHGHSEGAGALVFEVADAINAVADATGPISAVVAHSFACGAAALAVTEGLGADRLALIAPPLWPGGMGRFHRLAQKLGFPAEVAECARDLYRATTSPSRAEYDLPTELEHLDAEVLIVSSHDDEQVSSDDARTLAPRLVRGALLEVRGCDHRETARDPEVVRRIVAFVDGGLDRST